MPEVKTAPRTTGEVRQGRVKQVAEMAHKAFAEHKTKLLWLGLAGEAGQPMRTAAWRCGRPDSGINAFQIVSLPGRLCVFGDHGVLVLERTYDMLAWARNSIGDVHYFASKVPQEIPVKEYDGDMVRAWVHETDQEVLNDDHGEEFVREWISGGLRQDMLNAADEGEYAVHKVYFDSAIYDGDPPDFNNFTWRFLWQRECIKWFLENHGGFFQHD